MIDDLLIELKKVPAGFIPTGTFLMTIKPINLIVSLWILPSQWPVKHLC